MNENRKKQQQLNFFHITWCCYVFMVSKEIVHSSPCARFYFQVDAQIDSFSWFWLKLCEINS